MSEGWISVRQEMPPLDTRVSVVVRTGRNGRQDYLTGELKQLEDGVGFVDCSRQLPFDDPVTHWAHMPNSTPRRDVTLLTVAESVFRLADSARELIQSDPVRSARMRRASDKLKGKLDAVGLDVIRSAGAWKEISGDNPFPAAPMLVTDGTNIFKAQIQNRRADEGGGLGVFVCDTSRTLSHPQDELKGLTHWMALPRLPKFVWPA
jgi:hypothetical protein